MAKYRLEHHYVHGLLVKTRIVWLQEPFGSTEFEAVGIESWNCLAGQGDGMPQGVQMHSDYSVEVVKYAAS